VRKGHRIFFTTCEMLVQELLIAKRDLKLSKLIKKYSRYEGMIIDDLGYIRQTREEMEVVFTLLAERYERGSVLLTSNPPFSKWEGIFKDPLTTAAAIDPLVHHCMIIELNIPSYRQSRRRANCRRQGMREKKTRPPRPVRPGRRKMSTGRGKGKHSMLAKAYRINSKWTGPCDIAARCPRPALRPKRPALRASQGFAPGAANEQAKPSQHRKGACCRRLKNTKTTNKRNLNVAPLPKQ
jgi:hypothetical protein